jgi:hypothetical protein
LKLEQKIAASSAIDSVAELQTNETNRSGGILSQEIMEQSNELLKIMNEKWVCFTESMIHAND